MSNKELPNILIIIGPTAVGKTDVSVLTAKSLDGEIISADSAQVYRHMDIGTAKIRPEEMQGIAHHMMDEVNPDESFSVAHFRTRAEKYIGEISSRGKLPIIAGGTGLYINSLLNNLDFTDSIADEGFRNEMQQLANEKGNDYLHGLLESIDPVSYSKLHPNDARRVIRALEVFKHTKKPISYFQEESKKQSPRFNIAYVGLTMDRQKLYDRIDMRVDKMLQAGLIEEVQGLMKMGYDSSLVSMQALGYKEIVEYLNGSYPLETATEIIKRDSRHYAKRQLTWFRREERIFWVNTDNFFTRKHIVENIIRYSAGKITLI